MRLAMLHSCWAFLTRVIFRVPLGAGRGSHRRPTVILVQVRVRARALIDFFISTEGLA